MDIFQEKAVYGAQPEGEKKDRFLKGEREQLPPFSFITLTRWGTVPHRVSVLKP
jgi:hypothetical protein